MLLIELGDILLTSRSFGIDRIDTEMLDCVVGDVECLGDLLVGNVFMGDRSGVDGSESQQQASLFNLGLLLLRFLQ